MASVSTNDNNIKGFKGEVFDSCNFEGEHCFDTRNTRKQVNAKKDRQKVKWQAKHDYWQPDTNSDDDEEPSNGVQLTEHDKKTYTRDFHRWVVTNDKKAVIKGAKKREGRYQQSAKSCF
jgi:hypothetical protein